MNAKQLGLPLSFGKSNNNTNSWKKKQQTKNQEPSSVNSILKAAGYSTQKEQEIDLSKFHPPTLNQQITTNHDNAEEASDEEDDFSVVRPPKPVEISSENSTELNNTLPISKFVSLKGHTKAISALAIDSSCSRLLSGSFDYSIKFWDFHSMDANFESFREFSPYEGYPISHIAFSLTGDRFLASPDASNLKCFDRDGVEGITFRKGDQYLVDMSKTKGHIAAITGMTWHPTETDTVMTSSLDGTIRIWNVQQADQGSEQLIKARTSKGNKNPITSCCYNPNGSYILAGCKDGSLQLWKTFENNFSKPFLHAEQAHAANSDITCVKFARDGNTILSRSTDNHLKIWDKRKFKQALFDYEIEASFPQSECIFSPDDNIVVAGVASNKSSQSGNLYFINKQTGKIEKQMKPFEHTNAALIRLLWPSTLNQLFVGCSDGTIQVLYDEETSHKGILSCLQRGKRMKRMEDMIELAPQIIIPEEEYQERRERRRLQEIKKKIRHIPDLPPEKHLGIGHSGQIGDNLTHYLVQELGVIKKDDTLEEDPREALLKYDEKVKQNPFFVTNAYAKTQGTVPILDYSSDEKSDEEADDASSEEDHGPFHKKRKT